MKNMLLLSLGAVALASCAPMASVTAPASVPPAMYTLTRQTTAPSTVMPVGTANVNQTGTNTMTTIKLTGLAPMTYYVAHYHMMGKAVVNAGPTTQTVSPCNSNGPLIAASTMIGQSDSSGAVTLMGNVANSAIAMATYLNVHTANGPEGTPIDAGVACTSVTTVSR